jgi:predicted nucleic acid-binding protein
VSIVIDSSVVVAALVDSGPEGTWAEDAIERETLYAPDLLLAEATNILRRLERAKQITTPEAIAARDDLMELEVELFPFDIFSDRIWELRHTVTTYDAWYVAVAEALGFPLVTLDDRLARAAGPKCNFLTPGSRAALWDAF